MILKGCAENLGQLGRQIKTMDYCEGWSQSGLSCQEMVRPCSNGFPIRPVLWDSILLTFSGRTGGKQVIQNSGEGGAS